MNLAQAAYHERSLGQGLDDYYSEWGERPGLWWGGGAELLGLEGYAAPGSIVSLIEGRDPLTGDHLRRSTGNCFITRRVFDSATGRVVERQGKQSRVGGWDFAFSAPKSISLAVAFGDLETRREVLAAHRAGVSAALRLLEDEAVRVRVGAQGAERHETHGLLAVVIEHAWARAVSEGAAPDPQLHTHVVVANMAKSREDDVARWRTLDMQPVLREWKRAASATYQAVLRHEISTRLGWEWAEPRNGLAELRRWPPSLLRAFSRRREQIEAFLAGETGWARAQAAAIQTRQAKGAPRDEGADRAAARARLSEHLDARHLSELLSRGRHAPAPLDARRIGAVFQALLGEHGLTAHASSFLRGDVVRELACALGAAPDSASLLAAADAFLRLEDVVAVDERRFTTRELNAAQERITRLAHRSGPAGLVLSRSHAARGIARTESQLGFVLSDEQRALVHDVLADSGSISLVRAVAGSGKTTTLAAIAEAYALTGIPVAGVSPTGAAARVMTEAGIPARTVDRALLEREEALRAGIRPTSGIVLVDEAGAIGTRTLARLAEAVLAADAKLVLVGDDAQLPAVAAGAAYADLVEQTRLVHSLETPRRFTTAAGAPDLAEANALVHLRTGTLEGAAAYVHHKQETGTLKALDRDAALDAATAWHAHQVAAGHDPTHIALIARSNELRSALNERARVSMRQSGLLGLDIHGLAATPLAVGDVVVTRRNDPRLGTTNGARGRVTAISGRDLTLAMTDHRSLVIPHSYVRGGALEHAYAITGHLAQAATFDAAMVVAPPHHHTQQWSYTALSRSRTPTQLLLLTEAPREQPPEHAPGLQALEADEALPRLAVAMTRDESETQPRPTRLPDVPRHVSPSRSRSR